MTKTKTRDFQYALTRCNKLHKTLEQLINSLDKAYEDKGHWHYRAIEAEKQLALRARWDKENLPDDQAAFIQEFMNKYEPSKTSEEQTRTSET